MDRKNYNKKTISTFEIIAAYFVDVFYNHLYLNAKKSHTLRPSENGSLTDAYKIAIVAYQDGLTRNKNHYDSTVKGVLDTYKIHTRFSTMTMDAFINEFLQQFIPDEHYRILSDQEKYAFVNDIIMFVVTSLSSNILQPSMMKMVIDNHDDDGNIRIWLDHIVDLQIYKREDIYHKFLVREKKMKEPPKVGLEVLQKLQADREKIWVKLQKTVKENCVLKNELKKAKAMVEVLYTQISVMPDAETIETKNTEIQTLQSLLDEANTELKKSNAELKKLKMGLVAAPVSPVVKPIIKQEMPRNNAIDDLLSLVNDGETSLSASSDDTSGETGTYAETSVEGDNDNDDENDGETSGENENKVTVDNILFDGLDDDF